MTDDALFDMQPGEATTPEPGSSADRRRTLRQAQDLAAGYHPLLTSLYGRGPWAQLHDAAPTGTQPGDRTVPFTCGSCRFREVVSHHSRAYPKCTWRRDSQTGYPRITHGPASDIRAWWPACTDYSPR